MDIKTVCSVTSKPSMRVKTRALFRNAYSRLLMDFCSFQISKNPCRKGMDFLGATERTWTAGLLITNQLLYRLSYSSLSTCTRGDIEITNQLLYRLSYSSIIFKHARWYHIFSSASTPISRGEIRSIYALVLHITICIVAWSLAFFWCVAFPRS